MKGRGLMREMGLLRGEGLNEGWGLMRGPDLIGWGRGCGDGPEDLGSMQSLWGRGYGPVGGARGLWAGL